MRPLIACFLMSTLSLCATGCVSRAQVKARPAPSPTTIAVEVVNSGVMAFGIVEPTEALIRSDILSKNIGVPVAKGSASDLKLVVNITGTNFTAATAYEWQLVEVGSGRLIAQGAETAAFGHEGPAIADVVLAKLVNIDTSPFASDPNGALPIVTPDVPDKGADGWPASETPGDNAWAVIVGIETYRNPMSPATHAEADAKAFAAFAQETLGVPETHIKLLIGERATRSDMAGALFEWLPRNAVKPGGRVYVFFSGHGAPHVDTGAAYLVPYDADPAYLKSGGVAISELQEALGGLKGQSTMVFLDACFSGNGERSVLPEGTRPLVPVKDVAPVGGVITLSASGASQTTGMHGESSQGLFTHHLLQGLAGAADKDGDKNITLSEIIAHTTDKVEVEARRQNREQRPSATVPKGANPSALIVVESLQD